MIYAIKSNIIISTSRKPSQKTRRFAQFIKHYFNAIYINRGKMGFNKLINMANQESDSVLLILMETKGNPSNLDVYFLDKDCENPVFTVNFNVSLPQSNNRINVDSSKICIVNKNREIEPLLNYFTPIKTMEHIKENCIIIKDNHEYMAEVTFADKNSQMLSYKMYVKGYNIDGD